MNAIQNNIQTRKLNKKRAEMMDDFIRKHKTGGNGQNNQSQGIPNGYTQSGNGIGANANGVYGVQPNQNGIVAQGRNSVNMQDNPYNVTQMGNMPNLEGGRFNGRIPQSDGVFFQGSQNVGFPTNVDNVTQMGNLYNSNNREVDRYPQELAGLTGEDLQRAGLAYNQRIDNGGSDFGRAIQRAETPVAPQAPVYNNIDTAAAEVTNTPATSVADFKRYNDTNVNNYSPQGVADFRRYDSGYNTPVTNTPQRPVQQSSGYRPLSLNVSTLGKDEQSFPLFKYNRDLNNPSVFDDALDWLINRP